VQTRRGVGRRKGNTSEQGRVRGGQARVIGRAGRCSIPICEVGAFLELRQDAALAPARPLALAKVAPPDMEGLCYACFAGVLAEHHYAAARASPMGTGPLLNRSSQRTPCSLA
jgi:hypothetical protein